MTIVSPLLDAGPGTQEASVWAPPPPGPRPAPRRLSPQGEMIVATLVGLALIALWGLLYVLMLSPLQEARSQRVMYTSFRQDLPQGILPPNQPAQEGHPIALLSLPKASLHNVVVVEGTTGSSLSRGPGHLRGTPLPGEAGLSVLYGKSLTFGGPFGDLASLRGGEKATVETQEGTFTFVVSRVRRVGQPGAQPLPAGGGGLELVSSVGTGGLSGLGRIHPIYVDLSLQGSALPDSSGPATLASSEKVMGMSTAPIVQVVLALQLVIALVLAASWAYRRWAGPQVWLVGLPALVAGLWWLSSNACQMLPNVY